MATIVGPNYSAKMEKFKDMVLRLANSDPQNPLSSSQLAFIQHQLKLAFPVLHTPNHPAYSAMIQNAITELNEEGGSKEETISKYIKKNYEGLPWAHDMYLSHHLSKLCESDEIVCNSTGKRYNLPALARTQEDRSRRRERKLRLVCKRKERGNEDQEGNFGGERVIEVGGDVVDFQEEVFEEVGRNDDDEGNLSGGFVVEANGFLEEDSDEFRHSRTKPRRRSLVFVEECDEIRMSSVHKGEQDVVVERTNEDLDGCTSDASKLMHVPAECVEEAPIALISSSATNIGVEDDSELPVKELVFKENTIPAQAGIQEVNLGMKQLKQTSERKRKLLVSEDDEGDLGGGKGVEVSKSLIGFQEKNGKECGNSMEKTRRNLVATEDNGEVERTAVDGEEQNVMVESHNEVLVQGHTSDPECVEESPVPLISSPVTNIKFNNAPDLAVNESGLKESQLMIVVYKGDTSICEVSAEVNPIPDKKGRMIVCGLSCASEQKQIIRKISPKKRLKACHHEKSKVSLESMPSSSDLGIVPHLLEFDKKKPAYQYSRKTRSKVGQGKMKVSLQTMPSLPALVADLNLREHNQLQGKVSEMEIEMGPLWLELMLKQNYSIKCSVHTRSNCNRFCLDCMGDSFCNKCLSPHKDHRVIQIRTHSCHIMVKLDDMRPYLDMSNIQTYNFNSGECVILDVGIQPRNSMGDTYCEICNRGRIDSFRFCSLPCKLIAARLQYTKFLPSDQSQQACALSLHEGSSNEQLDSQENFNPSQLSGLEDLMSVEEEEDLPLQKVLEKCGKRKKQVDKKFTANDPSVIEPSNLSGSKSPLHLPNSECSKHQIKDLQREGQMDVEFSDAEASISKLVEGDMPTSYQKCDQEPKQSEATKNDAEGILDLHLQLVEELDKPATDLHSQNHTKQLKMDDQEKTRKITEATTEDVAGSSHLSPHQQEGLFEPATNQHLQQQIELKKDAQGRALILEVAKDDATISSDLHLQQLAGSSEPEIVVQVKKQKRNGRGRPRMYEKGIKKGQKSEERNKRPKKVVRGRQKKRDVNKEDSVVLLEPSELVEEIEHKLDDCFDKSVGEAYERELADDIHQKKKQKMDGGDQPDIQEVELDYHEIEVKEGKSDVESEVRHPKVKSGKSTIIHVPLSSKDQLRSRNKHQTQNRT